MPKKSMHAHPGTKETKAAGTLAAEKTVIDAETRAREAETRRLRLARLEQELLGPWPDVSRDRRPNFPLRKKASQ